MAHAIVALIAQYGLAVVFVNVLSEQAGAPLPSAPILVVAGALAADARLSLAGILLVALLACLLGDLPWYWAGRRFGAPLMRTLCRISLSPDSCVRHSEEQFERWGGPVLVVAKFVPGLSMVAPPLAGAMRLPIHVFLLLDGAGSLLWVGVPVALGYVLSAQIDDLLVAVTNAGTAALVVVVVLFVLYIVAKWWRRRALLLALRMARITVEELHRAIADGRPPLVVDVRSKTSRRLDTRVVPGALLLNPDCVEHALHDVPLDRELVIYCDCPNETSSARVAKLLMTRGYRHVRPLQGGLDAWGAAGYPVQRLPSAVEGSSNGVIREPA